MSIFWEKRFEAGAQKVTEELLPDAPGAQTTRSCNVASTEIKGCS